MFERILVPLDGSKLAERSIAHAEFFAQVFGSQITLLEVLDSSSYNETLTPIEPLNWQIQKVEAERYLQEITSRLCGKNCKADYILKEGRAPEHIIDTAHSENIDLVILCTHGASGMTRWNMSSVVAKVISKIYLPVLLIRSFQEGPETAPAQETTVDNDQPDIMPSLYRRVLFPIDTSRRAECSLPAAVSIVQGLIGDKDQDASTDSPAPLLLAAVLQPPELPIPTPYSTEINTLIEALMKASREAVETYLDGVQQHVPVRSETRIVESESIPAAIHTLAEQENIDLVVLCAHGKTGQVNWPYGSVAWNYLEHGERNVLVIQDIPRSQIRPTASEIAAQKSGRR